MGVVGLSPVMQLLLILIFFYILDTYCYSNLLNDVEGHHRAILPCSSAKYYLNDIYVHSAVRTIDFLLAAYTHPLPFSNPSFIPLLLLPALIACRRKNK